MRSIRKTLADSHISAVAIVVLVLWSITAGYSALSEPIYRAATFLFTAVAIRDVPYISPTMTAYNRLMYWNSFSNLTGALICLAAAWLLSRWTFGAGPIASLGKYRELLTRRTNLE
jgi:hypothetical protein